MDLHDAENLARQLLARHGLGQWRFGFNRRKRTLGLCRYEERRIELSVHFVAAHDEPEIRDVVLHEIAHALAGHAAAHGPRWQSYCHVIGARPERCSSNSRMPEGRWQAVCAGCSRQFSRFRRPMRNRHYSCPQCGPSRGQLAFRTRENHKDTKGTKTRKRVK